MTADIVTYLNGDSGLQPFTGSALKAVDQLPAKLQRQPPAQWISTLKGLTSSGKVKSLEIEDIGIFNWLENSAKENIKSITRNEIFEYIKNRQVTIKEVELGQTKYQNLSHRRLDTESTYQEILLIANSQKSNKEDELELIEYEIEQFNLNLDTFNEDPGLVLELTRKRKLVMDELERAWDFPHHHFSEKVNGKHGKNLLVHGRVLITGGTYFIEEIQSDWGQKERNSLRGQKIVNGPFITETKAWAGLMLRRLLQRAAQNPKIEKVAWIRAGLHNGGMSVQEGGLHDDFYTKLIPSIVEKIIKESKEKPIIDTIQIGHTIFEKIPQISMTVPVRTLLQAQQPLYSMTQILKNKMPISERTKIDLIQRSRNMLGNRVQIQLLDHVWDVANGQEIAGKYIGNVIQASLHSKDVREVLDHEGFHFAYHKLMTRNEQMIVDQCFSWRNSANQQVRRKLIERGDYAAAAQCDRSSEAAAHGFALYCAGDFKFDAEDSEAHGMFQVIKEGFEALIQWFRDLVYANECTTAEQIFDSLRNGNMAEEHIQHDAQHYRGQGQKP